MNYKETIEYLYNSAPMFEKVGAGAYKEGLSNTHVLDNHFGNPHHNYKTIHIAGTNGKGSVSHTLASILQVAGYKVGLYTSPHLVDFRERIRVNGKTISEKYVIDFVENERAFFEPLHPSFFEITTALAFKYFADMNVDIAVIEVGLGGRLDCTNIITPVLSVITNISYDHTQFLGNTLAKIAGEKAGIIKKGIPVVIGETTKETRPVFESKAEEMHSPIFFAEEDKEILSSESTKEGGRIYNTRSIGAVEGELGGLCQEKNANTIFCALKRLANGGFICGCNKEMPVDLRCKDIKTGFNNVCELTGLMGRWQVIQNNPKVICDTGHNVGGWLYISKQLHDVSCDKMHIVFGMVNDKDIKGVMELLPKNAMYYFTKANVKRALDEHILINLAQNYNLQGKAYPNVKEAYNAAMSAAGKDDFIFVGGSSYIVSDFLSNMI
jgi:dihydrofolate synthase/folylpolyglutamate synthase